MAKENQNMLRHLSRVVGIILFVSLCLPCFSAPSNDNGINYAVYFSPNGCCADAIVGSLDKATNSIYVQAYSFTSATIAKALVDAHKRGIKVSVILDKGQKTAKYSSADFVQRSGITTYIDSKHAIAHNKVMIIDERIVITGSFNFTKAAEENNAENLLIIDDARLARKYLENWKAHQEHSTIYEGK